MDRFRSIKICLLICIGAWVPFAKASSDSGWRVNLGSFALYDNNLFKRDTGREAEDLVISTIAGFELDKKLSRQYVSFDAQLIDNRYSEFDRLNYQSKNLLTQWDWEVTSKLAGRVRADYDESISDFTQYAYARKNIKKQEKLFLDLEWRFSKAVYFTLGGGLSNQKNSANVQEDRAYESNSLKSGLKFLGRSGSFLSFSVKEANGSYKSDSSLGGSRPGTGYEESSGEIGFFWPLTAKSVIKGHVAYVERFHDVDERRDYRGETGMFSYRVPLSAKFSLAADLSRKLVSFQSTTQSDNYLLSIGEAYYNSSYYQGDKVSLSANWNLTSKMALTASTAKEWRSFLGGLTSSREQRDDQINSTELTYTWRPIDNFEISCSAIHKARVSNITHAEFISDAGSLSLSFQF